jgi:hypothetical protein
LILCVLVATAQKPEKVKTKTEKGRDGMSEIKYQVLKSNKKTMHGFYEKKNTIYDQVVVSGTYIFGKKEGLWQEWRVNQIDLKSEGYYINGKKVGVWEYADFMGKPIHIYNHDTNTLTFDSTCGKNYPRDVILNGEKVSKVMDCTPNLLGGLQNLIDAINLEVFIFEAKSNNPRGVIVDISILINKNGEIVEIDTNGSRLSKEYITILEEEIYNPELVWLPGILNGKKVDSYLSFGVYSLNN